MPSSEQRGQPDRAPKPETLSVPMKSTRPSRKDRKRNQQLRFLREYSDGAGRTRRSADLKEMIASGAVDAVIMAGVDEEQRRRTPPRFVGNDRIYSGASRSFEASFMDDYWSRQTQGGAKVYCAHAQCGNEIDMTLVHGGDRRTIDHIRDWSTVKTELETEQVCCNGYHWEVVMDAVMRAAFQDETNLVPMHASCNSSKSGSKDHDSIAPRNIGLCPDSVSCNLPKAVT